MTLAEFDVMMAEALTRIGMNVPSLRHRYAPLGSWEANAVRNHSLIATRGPASVAIDLEDALASGEGTGTILPSYLKSIATNLRRMREFGDDGGRPFRMPKSIPEEAVRSYAAHLDRYGSTVCGHEYLERFGADGIREALADHGCEVRVDVLENHFDPMTMTNCECDGSGYSRVVAIRPTVRLTLLRKGGQKQMRPGRERRPVRLFSSWSSYMGKEVAL